MPEWWTYRLEDFLLFSPRTYWRLIEAQNAAFWPWQLAALAIGLALVLLVHWRPDKARPVVAPVLAAASAFVAFSFLQRYAAINWAVAYAVPAFWAEAFLLLVAAALPRGFAFGRDTTSRAGLALAIGGLLYPAATILFGRPWSAAEVFGIAPDPTAIVTVGILLSARGWLLLALLPIPILWCVASGLTLAAMEDGQAWLPLAAAAFGLVASLLRLPAAVSHISRRTPRP